MDEPGTKRAVTFIDGQNLFRHAKSAFGYYHPNYDPIKLANAVCAHHGWLQHGVQFYTGVPRPQHDYRWHQYWIRRLTALNRAKVNVFSRPLAYNHQLIEHPDGSKSRLAVARVKVRRHMDGALSVWHGPRRLARYGPDGQPLAEPLERAA